MIKDMLRVCVYVCVCAGTMCVSPCQNYSW